MDILGFEKILYHPGKIKKLVNNELQFPVHCTISLSNYCNHKCLWCTAYEYQKDKAKSIKREDLLSFLDKASRRGLKAVGYVGNGEPSAYPGFNDLVKEVHSMGIEQGIFTNGYLMHRSLDELIDYFTYVRISLDAGSEEVHNYTHDVKGHYGKIIENIESLVRKRKNRSPAIGIQYATHHENVDDLENALEMASEIGVDYFSIKPVFNRGSVGERIEKNKLTVEILNPLVYSLKAKFEKKGFTIYYRPHQVLAEAADHNTLDYKKCVAGFFNLNLYEDNKLVFCGPNRISVGSINDDFDQIERNILELSENLDLSKCPSGCRYHGLNYMVETIMDETKADLYHPNFL